MDDLTRDWLLVPTTARDAGRRLDRFTAIEPGARAGELAVTTGSGRRCTATLTSPGAGIVRLRIATAGPAPAADSPLLVDGYTDAPLDVVSADDGVTAAGPDVELRWHPGAGGLRLGPLHEAAYVGTLVGPGLGTGLVGDDTGDVGSQVTFALDPDAAVFGGGEAFQGPDLRGRVRRCINVETHGAAGLDQSYLSVPLFWTDAGWGAFVHTGAPVRADVGSTHPSVLALDVDAPVTDLFLYVGDAATILRRHQQVTGMVGRIPEWALGVWTSRCSYFSAGEIEAVVDGYETAGCPLDVVHVDAWQVGDVVADLTTAWEIDRDRFPAGWGKQLADRGVRLSLWHNPYLRAGTAVGDEAVTRGFVLRDRDGQLVGTNDMPDRLVVDMTSPQARAWWRDLVRRLLVDEGAVSIKADFAEEIPPTAACADGSTGWGIRNSYAVLYQRESHAALCEATEDGAAVMFCRSGTAGAQRYPCHWVGDTPSTWEGMAAALRACLSLSLSGFGIVASDVGGFWTEAAIELAGKASHDFDPSLFTADVDAELFARWSQWGALSPVLRFHGTGRREPWAYPEPFSSVAVEACRLRQQIRPYLAAAAAEAATTGTPMMRPMPLAAPGDRAARDATLQYLLGPDLLVAPVLRPGGHVSVFAPSPGWTGLAGAPMLDHAGWHDLRLELAALPAWVRPGAGLQVEVPS